MKSRNKGILYIILSAFCFALMGVFIRLSGNLPSMQKSFFRNLVAFFFAGILLIREKERPQISKGVLLPLVLRSLFGTLGIVCNYYAIDHLVLSDASMLNKMSPFFAILFSYFILKEKFTLWQGTAVFVAFLGGLFIIKPTFSNMELLPALIGLTGGIAAGAAYTFVRQLGQKGVKGSFVVLFFSAFSCLFTLPFVIFGYAPMSLYQFFMLMGAGLAAAGGQFSITAAYFHAPAKEISVFDYSQIVFSAGFGFFLFGQVPDLMSVAGYLIICSMAVWMFFYNRKKGK